MQIRPEEEELMGEKLDEMCRLRQFPSIKIGWRSNKGPDGRSVGGVYVSGLADYPGDPEAACQTRYEAEEKLKRKGLSYTKS